MTPARGDGEFDDTRPTAYDAEAAADAWQRDTYCRRPTA